MRNLLFHAQLHLFTTYFNFLRKGIAVEFIRNIQRQRFGFDVIRMLGEGILNFLGSGVKQVDPIIHFKIRLFSELLNMPHQIAGQALRQQFVGQQCIQSEQAAIAFEDDEIFLGLSIQHDFIVFQRDAFAIELQRNSELRVYALDRFFHGQCLKQLAESSAHLCRISVPIS